MKIKDFIKKNKLSICFILLFSCLTIFILSFAFRDADYFWHIKAGEYMVNHGLLNHDVFSWSVYGKYWMSHEWLFEIILYGFKCIFGNIHILVYAFVCILSLFLIIFFSNKKEFLKNPLFGIVWCFLGIILIYFVQGRPQLLSFILLCLSIWFCIDLYRNKDSKKIYFMPLLSIIWANVHGGSSNLGYLFCFIFLTVGLFNFDIGKVKSNRLSKKQLYKYLVIGIISILCISINLHGFKMIIYPYENMANSLMISTISEWRATSLSDINHYHYLVFIVVIFFIMLFSKKKINFIDLVLFGISIYLGLKSIRFWGYTYIIMSYVIFNYIEKRREDSGTKAIMLVISCLLVVVFITRVDSIYKKINHSYLNDKVISLIKSKKPKRLFNMYDFGGELVNSDIKVFIDGRADLYSKYNYKDYIDISTTDVNYIDKFNKYDFDYCLVSKKYPINDYLKYNDNYEIIYNEKSILLYKKRAN